MYTISTTCSSIFHSYVKSPEAISCKRWCPPVINWLSTPLTILLRTMNPSQPSYETSQQSKGHHLASSRRLWFVNPINYRSATMVSLNQVSQARTCDPLATVPDSWLVPSMAKKALVNNHVHSSRSLHIFIWPYQVWCISKTVSPLVTHLELGTMVILTYINHLFTTYAYGHYPLVMCFLSGMTPKK